ncbi:MAG: DUF1800 domain-containing protein [Nocardioidaceae bacterium]
MADSPSSRRSVLLGGAVLTGTLASQAVLAAPASAATVNPYRKTVAPSAWQRHLMNRMGCGYSRSTFGQMRAAGSADAWFSAQLSPAKVTESAKATAVPTWFPDLDLAPAQKWRNATSGVKGGWEYAADLAGYSMLRRVYSNRQVLESMVDFWSNHLHVHADTDLGWVHRASYDRLIRRHALGRFDEMLVAATLHPAMLLYLDNWTSVRNAPNENHGRELLELHTVGRASGYTEQMVKDSAKILSGYTVEAFTTWTGYYDPGRHTTGPVQVLGFSSANASPDGSAMTKDYLRYLAHHPATALTIARKLARHFVADAPSTDLVTHLAQVFRSSGTDIKATLKALVAHPDFHAATGTLVRTPIEDFVATCRVLGVNVAAPTADGSFARTAIWVPQTTLLFQWPRPDGSPYGDAVWSSATRMLNSFRMHWDLAAGWWPTKDVSYRRPAAWLPQQQIRLDQYVDHLCRMVLGKPSTSRILSASISAVGYGPSALITADHPVSGWLFVRLMGVLLDSPDHMRR